MKKGREFIPIIIAILNVSHSCKCDNNHNTMILADVMLIDLYYYRTDLFLQVYLVNYINISVNQF